MTARIKLSIVLVVALAAAGCSAGAGVGTRAVPDSLADSARLRGRAVSEIGGDFRHLYVANKGNNTVTVYSPDGSLLRTIRSGIHSPRHLALDGSGNLYVANGRSKSPASEADVTMYMPGQTVPALTITEGIGGRGPGPLSLAVDAAGNLYAGNETTASDDVTVYAPGSTSILRTIKNGIYNPEALAFDRTNNLYVANNSLIPFNDDDVTVYAPGSIKYFRAISNKVFRPQALAFDSAGNLYVANQQGAGYDNVTVYEPGSDRALRRITGKIYYPRGLAFDGSERLYVASCGNGCGGTGSDHGRITVFRDVGQVFVQTITDGIDTPVALAFSPSGELYVANNLQFEAGRVTVYASGSDRLLRTITDGISKPVALLFGP